MPLSDHIARHQEQWSTCNVKSNETEAKLGKIEAHMTAVKIKSEEQLQALLTKIESQQSAVMKNVLQINRKIMFLRFDRVGSRLFYIEHNLGQNWTTCNRMGGHLASFKSEEEFKDISARLNKDTSYRLGINDFAEKGLFISVSSGKTAPFLKWKPGEPKYNHKDQHCVTAVDSCSSNIHFIVEADDF